MILDGNLNESQKKKISKVLRSQKCINVKAWGVNLWWRKILVSFKYCVILITVISLFFQWWVRIHFPHITAFAFCRFLVSMLCAIWAGIVVYAFDCIVHVYECLYEPRSTCDCISVHMHVCVCICVYKREQEKDRETREKGRMSIRMYLPWYVCLCVCVCCL